MSLKIFMDGDEFSWRKGLTGLTALLFSTAVIGFLIKNDFQELPGSYQVIIGGVFAFYFGKRFIDSLTIKK